MNIYILYIYYMKNFKQNTETNTNAETNSSIQKYNLQILKIDRIFSVNISEYRYNKQITKIDYIADSL